MRDFAKFSPLFWTRGSGKRLRGKPRGQIVAMYLVTCPAANMIGIYYVPAVTIAHETGLTLSDVTAGLAECAAAGFAYYDHEHDLAWVPNMASYQIGDELKPGDKRRAGVVAELAKAGRHRFVADFYLRYGSPFALGECPFQGETVLTEAPSKPLPIEAPSMGLASPLGGASGIMGEVREETETETETETEKDGKRPEAASPPPKAKRVTHRNPETSVPPSEATTDEVTAFAARWKIPHEHPEFSAFLDGHRKKESRWRDWAAAWRMWLRNADRFKPNGHGARATLQPADPNAPWMTLEGFGT